MTWETTLQALGAGSHCVELASSNGRFTALVKVTDKGFVHLFKKPDEGDMYTPWLLVRGDRLEHLAKIEVELWAYQNAELMRQFEQPQTRHFQGSIVSKFQVDQIWRAKQPANSGGLVNDRVIIYVGSFGQVQYDSPSVAHGRRYPTVGEAVFDKWAGRLIEEKELPLDEWAPWNFQNRVANK